MNAPQPPSPRRRLQELLAIPDNQRTDAEWDELNELEISLAPGNREGAPDPNLRRPTPSTGLGRKPARGPRPGGGQQKQGGQQKPGGQSRPAPRPQQSQPQSQPQPPQQAPQQQSQPPQQQSQPPQQPRAAAPVAAAVPGEEGAPKKPARKFRKRTPKPAAPQE